MKREQVEAMLATLCGAFDLECPKTRLWINGTGRAHYSPSRKQIFISSLVGLRGWDREMTVLHEFTHYLFHSKIGWSKNTRKYSWHGPLFRALLVEVAEFWFGDAKKYPWENEYTSVKLWAKKQGLLQ
jgi:hypothetical protein